VVFSGLLCACGANDANTLRIEGWTTSRALNESVVIGFSTDLDPLSATPASVRVFSAQGQPLEHRLRVRGRELLLTLSLDEELMRDPPESCRVQLAGLPSVHALRSRSAAALAGARSLVVRLQPRLASAGRVRLQSINGRSADERGSVPHAGRIQLTFEGVVDPDSVTPTNCPLFPVAAGLQLKPVLPDTRWSLQGSRCEIQLVVPSGSGPLELIWKRLGLKGLDGLPSEGPLVVTLSSS
jgi:hypothetical protein